MKRGVTMSRKPARKPIWIVLVIALMTAACSSDSTATTSTAVTEPTESTEQQETTPDAASSRFSPGVLDSGATIATFEQDPVVVHTYTNPEAGFGNTTVVIETENSVVLIDAHFSERSAREFRDFAESFGKPIERLIVTHDHPDHIGGIEPVFGDIETYATSGVVAAAAAAGVTITTELSSTTEVIDGVEFVFDTYLDAEAEEQVVIRVPDAGVIAAGDLVYGDYHAVMSPTFDNWLSILNTLAATDGVELVLPGHGHPDDATVIDRAIEYLETARSTYAQSDDADSFNAAMIAAYPDIAGSALLEFGSDRLFPKS